MSSRLLLALFAAPLVGLAVLAFTARRSVEHDHSPTVDEELFGGTPPVATPAVPTTAVWELVCPGEDPRSWGPYSSPDPCRNQRTLVWNTCHHPLLAPNRPNPDFVQIASICRDALNGSLCRCEYLVVTARTSDEVLQAQ